MALSFTGLLTRLRKGKVEDDMTIQLQNLMAACRRTGGKGSFTLKVNVCPKGSLNHEMHITTQVAVKMPANPVYGDTSIVWALEDGELVTDDTEQGKLDLRDELRDQRQLRQAADALTAGRN